VLFFGNGVIFCNRSENKEDDSGNHAEREEETEEDEEEEGEEGEEDEEEEEDEEDEKDETEVMSDEDSFPFSPYVDMGAQVRKRKRKNPDSRETRSVHFAPQDADEAEAVLVPLPASLQPSHVPVSLPPMPVPFRASPSADLVRPIASKPAVSANPATVGRLTSPVALAPLLPQASTTLAPVLQNRQPLRAISPVPNEAPQANVNLLSAAASKPPVSFAQSFAASIQALFPPAPRQTALKDFFPCVKPVK